ncbi:MAG TPA: SDR family oxidoreductase [Gemmataceae bacterium]|jgi:nucleoside-diphosphate-sugar epimerase|nr:SDR family oxidoreductase [Gemmataceae bacterium]
MTHLILGCGYLGRVVARQWLAAGQRVSALTRAHGDQLRALGIEPVIGDVTDPTLQLPTADVVLYAVGLDHSAGVPMRDVYLGGLTNVLSSLSGARRFVYVSSTSVYGQADGSWVDEVAPTEPAAESGKIVLECEQFLRARRPDIIVLRFAGIYGPKRVIRRAAVERGEALATDPDGWLNLIHVADGARAVIAAAERATAGSTFNVSDGRPVTRRGFYEEMAQLLGAPPPSFTPANERTNRQIDNGRLRAELAFRPQFPDYRSGLRDAIGDRS